MFARFCSEEFTVLAVVDHSLHSLSSCGGLSKTEWSLLNSILRTTRPRYTLQTNRESRTDSLPVTNFPPKVS
jgi:hypothetical protein